MNIAELTINSHRGWHGLHFSRSRLSCGMGQRDPLIGALLPDLDVFVLDHTQVRWTNERVDHELDQELDLKGDQDSANVNTL